MKKSWMLKFLNLWPPFLGAGIRVRRLSSDFKEIDVAMNLHFWNRNYVGTQFGGSMYSMIDPFLVIMLIENLGRDYIVWDKAATIRFKKPGTGRVHAEFRLTQDFIDQLRNEANEKPKVEPVLQVLIKNDQGDVIAEVDKTLYICRKDKRRK